MLDAPIFAFDNSYARLPERFYARQDPERWPEPRLLRLNRPLAEALGLDPQRLASPEGVAALSGARPPEDAEPLAMAYAGHQFGGWVPQLGDGRAILLGEHVGPDGTRWDLHLKGAGRTPFSRMGDGRAALGPVLREHLVSEAMAALGVPTTRSLAALTTGETVMRETPSPGAMLARVARSHVRVGTFQFFAGRGDEAGVRALLEHCVERLHPDLAAAEAPALAFLERVIAVTADLVARWQAVGFIHGVMNTDNLSVAGETIDYGPCAFMDAYHPATVFSSIDARGRYAYGNQPLIAQWNLAQLASALLPLIAPEAEAAVARAQAAVDAYPARFDAAWTREFRPKLGLAEAREDDARLAADLLAAMAEAGADFTLTFRRLSEGGPEAAREGFAEPAAFEAWAARWRERLAAEGRAEPEALDAMRRVNPAVIPRNHRVEAALAAAHAGDLAPLDALWDAVRRPFEPPADPALTQPPQPEEVVRATFCGT
jgi:uncharacterized protein YdiU (UPF0061 family)